MSVKLQLTQKGVHFTVAPKQYIRLVCPRCKQLQVKNWDDPEFYYSLTKQRGHCFRCELRVPSQKAFLALFNLSVLGGSIPRPAQEKPSILWPSPLPELCVPAYQSKRAKEYLGGRNIYRKEIERYGILFCRDGWYADRIIIPVFSHRKSYCTFVSRTINSTLPAGRKVYEFCSKSGISHLLFNLCFFRHQSTVWLTEGTFDAFHTFPYSVATFGKHISDPQINLLKLKGFTRVVLMWDWDAWATTPDLWNGVISRLKRHFFVTPVKLPHQGTDPTNYSMDELKTMVQDVRITIN
jgi:DNA primase